PDPALNLGLGLNSQTQGREQQVTGWGGLLSALERARILFCIIIMANPLKRLSCAVAAVLITFATSNAQPGSPAPATSPGAALPAAAPASAAPGNAPVLVVQSSGAAAAPTPKPAGAATTSTTATEQDTVVESGGVGVREFQGDDVGQVLRLLARQAK